MVNIGRENLTKCNKQTVQRSSSLNGVSSMNQSRLVGSVQNLSRMKIFVSPTTGGLMELNMRPEDTIQSLKWLVSRRLRVPPQKISLIFKNRLLTYGSLQDNQVIDGSRLTLLPNMESGVSVQKAPDTGVVQALEHLSDSQVDNFLSGRAPLLLAMRTGDHMMFVQLQLSTSHYASRSKTRRPSQCMSSNQSSTSSPEMMTSTAPNNSSLHALIKPTALPSSATSSPTFSSYCHHGSFSSNLSEAGRSLSQKLKELSQVTATPSSTSRPLISSVGCSSCMSPAPSPSCSGTSIESVLDHGQGIYSGTFSGTLDTSLQDSSGKPKRDISTIIHILNDLLSTKRQCSAHQCLPPNVQPQQNSQQQQQQQQQQQPRHSMSTNQKLPTSSMQRSESLRHDYASSSKNITEEHALRGKVRQIQMMMEEKKLHRKARRTARAPYTWHSTAANKCNIDDMSQPGSPADLDTMEVTEASYSSNGTASNSKPLGHETVAV